MAFNLVDNVAYKISLDIVEDFVSMNYDEFIQNEPNDDLKIVKWELSIELKLLKDKDDLTIKYYTNFFKSLFEPLLKYNSYYYTNKKVDSIPLSTINDEDDSNFYCKNYDKSFNHYLTFNFQIYNNSSSEKLESGFSLNSPSKKLESSFSSISPFLIKFNFYCKEKLNDNEIGDQDYLDFQPSRNIKITYNYINNLKFCILKIYSILKAEGVYRLLSEEDNLKLDYSEQGIFKGEQWIYSVIENHYQKIVYNFELYIAYCEKENIYIDIKQIGERTSYIREYVKKIYNIKIY